MALPIPAGVPEISKWWYYAYYYGNIDGCSYAFGAQANQNQANTAYLGRNVWWGTALGGAAGGACFHPQCLDWNGTLQTSGGNNAPLGSASSGRWKAEVLDVMDGSSPKVDHPTDVAPNILGTRDVDATFPGHAAIAAWNPGGANSVGDRTVFVEQCVQAWATLLLTLPRLTIFRLWHEHGNGTYHDTDNARFVSNWRKIVQYLKDLGAVGDNCLTAKGMIAWCPAASASSPGPDYQTFPGTQYVHFIGRDIYTHGPPNNTEFIAAGQQWYDEYKPDTESSPRGPGNPDNRPLVVFESDQEIDDPGYLRKTQEHFDRLTGTWLDNGQPRVVGGHANPAHDGPWDGISGWLWWDAGAVPNTTAANDQMINTLNTPYFLPDGLAAEPGGTVAVAPGLVHLEGWDHRGVDANAVRGGGGLPTTLLNRRLIDAHNPGALGWDATKVHHAHTDSASMFCQNPGVAANWQFLLSGTSQFVVGHLAFRFHVLPNADNYLVRCIDTTATGVGHDLQVRTTGAMRLATGGVNSPTTPEVISLDQWYILEWLAEAAGSSHSVTWKVYPAGLSATPLIAERTDTATGLTDQRFAECRVGLGAATVTSVDWNIDDWILSETDTEYPLGESYVKLYKATGKGTHNDGAHFTNFAAAAVTNGSPQNSHLDVDDVPSVTTTGVQQTSVGAANYLEYTMSTAGESIAPRAVRLLGSFFPAATTANSADLRLHEGGADSAAMTYDASAVAAAQEWHASLFPNKPSGGAWTASALQGTTVRFGYATNTTNPPKLADVYLQAAFLASTDIDLVGGSVTLNSQAFGGTVATTGSVDVTGGSVAPLMRAFGGTAVIGGGSISVSAPSLTAVDAGTLEVLIGVAEGVNQFTPGTGFIEKADIVQNLASTANDQTLFIAYKVVPAGPTNTATGALDTSASWATMHLLVTPTPITLSVFTPAADESVGANPGDVYDVSGTATSGGGTPNVTVNGISVPLDASGNFTYPLALVGGANPVSVVAQEPSGAQRMVSVFRVVTVTVPDTGGGGGGPSDPVELSDDMLRIQKIIRESGLDPR